MPDAKYYSIRFPPLLEQLNVSAKSNLEIWKAEDATTFLHSEFLKFPRIGHSQYLATSESDKHSTGQFFRAIGFSLVFRREVVRRIDKSDYLSYFMTGVRCGGSISIANGDLDYVLDMLVVLFSVSAVDLRSELQCTSSSWQLHRITVPPEIVCRL